MTPELEVRYGRCHGPGCEEPAANHFCSEPCWRAWHRRSNAGGQTPADFVLEWRHPHLGEIREAACRRHFVDARAALRALGMGHAGSWADGEVCVRCVHDGKETRDWIRSAVVPDLAPGVGVSSSKEQKP